MATSNPLAGRISFDASEAKAAIADFVSVVQKAFGTIADAAKRIEAVTLPTDKAKADLEALAQAGAESVGKISEAAKSADITLPVERPQTQLSLLGDTAKTVLDAISSTASQAASGFDKLASSIGNAKTALVGLALGGTVVAFTNTLKDLVVEFSNLSLGDKLQKDLSGVDTLKQSIEQMGESARAGFGQLEQGANTLTDVQAATANTNRAFTDMQDELGGIGKKAPTALEGLASALTLLGVKAEDVQHSFKGLALGIQTQLDKLRSSSSSLTGLLARNALAVEQSNQLQIRSAESVAAAELNLAAVRERVRLARGGAADPAFAQQLAEQLDRLALEEAELRVEQARIAQQQAVQAAADNRRKANEAEANSLENLIKLVNNLVAGVTVIGPKVNATAENIVTGFIAPLGKSATAVRQFSGSIDDLNRNAPNLVPIFNRLADLFKGTGDQALNARIANILFAGSINDELLKALSKGSQGLTQARDLAKSIADLQKNFTSDNLTAFASQLLKIKDPVDRLQKATSVLGETFGNLLVDALSKSGGQAREAVTLFDGVVKQFAANTKTAGEFKAAIDNLKKAFFEVGAATTKSNLDLGLLVAPAATPIINAFADGIRKLNVDLRKLAADVGSSVKPVIDDFFKLLAGGGKQVDTATLATSFGRAINEIVIPAFRNLIEIVKQAAATISTALGTDVSPALVALGAALPFLIGGFNTLGLVIAALFGANSSPLIESFKKKLKSIGIDVDEIKASFDELFTGTKKEVDDFIGPRQQTFVEQLKEALPTLNDIKAALTSTPAIIAEVIAAFLLFRKAVGAIAPAFGKQFTADGGLAILAIGEMTGALRVLLEVVGLVSLAVIILERSLLILSRLGFAGAAIGLIILITQGEKLKPVFDAAAFSLNQFFRIVTQGTFLEGFIPEGFFTQAGLFKAAIDGLAFATGALFLRLVGLANPIAGLIAAIVVGLKEMSDPKFQKQAQQEARELIDSVFGGDFQKKAQQQFRDLGETIRKFFADLGNAQIFKGIVDAIDGVKQKISDLVLTPIVGAWDWLKISFFEVIDSIKAKAQELIDFVKSKLPAGVGAAAPSSQLAIDAGINDIVSGLKEFDQKVQASKTLWQQFLDLISIGSAKASELPGGPQPAVASGQFGALQQGASAAFQAIQAAAAQAFAAIEAAANALGQALALSFQTAATAIQGVWSGIGGFVTGVLSQISGQVDAMVSQVESAASRALASLQQVIDKAREAGAALGGAGGGESVAPGFAAGGVIRGPGTGTSDSILALLGRSLIRVSNGEGILTARALRYYGSDIVAAINSFRMPRLPNFSIGGLLDGIGRSLAVPIPRYADGGLLGSLAVAGAGGGVERLHPVTINFQGRRTVGLASASVVRALKREAAMEELVMPGRQPSHFK